MDVPGVVPESVECPGCHAPLDLTGQTPTPDEVRAFAADATPQKLKRSKVIDKLIARPSFPDYWTMKWGDLLQSNRKFLGEDGARQFREWIRGEVAANTPYDQFARKILTASGSNRENPAASYYKILRTPTETMENTTHLFLATRFNCNKCHDHPFDKWTQKEFYSLAAFTAGIEYRSPEKININNKDIDKASSKDGKESNEARQAKQLMRLNRGGVSHNDKKQLKFPHDYQYSNAKPEQIATPAVLWGTAPSKIDNHDRRSLPVGREHLDVAASLHNLADLRKDRTLRTACNKAGASPAPAPASPSAATSKEDNTK